MKYYFITVKIVISHNDSEMINEVIEGTPFSYVLHYKSLGGDYSDRYILYAEEITKEQYLQHKNTFD